MPRTTIKGCSHYYRLEGDPAKPSLFLVHPVGADHAMWDAVVPSLTQSFQVLRYDLRGHGGTDTPPENCTVEQLADDLLALADHVGWSRFALCGSSIGALTSLQVALAAPERVTSLVLVSASPRIGAPPGGWEGRMNAALDRGMEPLAGPMVERMFTAAYRAQAPAPLHTIKSVFLRTDPRGYAACVHALITADFEPLLHRVGCRTLVIRGTDDALAQRNSVETLANGIAGARMIEVPGAHFPQVEDPAAFLAVVRPFLIAS